MAVDQHVQIYINAQEAAQLTLDSQKMMNTQIESSFQVAAVVHLRMRHPTAVKSLLVAMEEQKLAEVASVFKAHRVLLMENCIRMAAPKQAAALALLKPVTEERMKQESSEKAEIVLVVSHIVGLVAGVITAALGVMMSQEAAAVLATSIRSI